jgi:hypothetical protein
LGWNKFIDWKSLKNLHDRIAFTEENSWHKFLKRWSSSPAGAIPYSWLLCLHSFPRILFTARIPQWSFSHGLGSKHEKQTSEFRPTEPKAGSG